jgi:hypothetical protein
MQKAHLDTSILIELFKETALSIPVVKALQPFGFTSTSTYARKEFKAAWLRDLGWIHDACRSAATPNELAELVVGVGAKRCNELAQAWLFPCDVYAFTERGRAQIREETEI